MITLCPQSCVSCSPTRRAAMSVAPPGGKGTMSFTGFCGHCCATAVKLKNAAHKSTSARMPILLVFAPILQGERERQSRGQRDGARSRGQALLPFMPVEELDREHPQPAAEMRGEQHHDAPFGELHDRLLGPAQERVHLQPQAERPEVHW